MAPYWGSCYHDITGDVDMDQLFMMIPARFLHYKVSVFFGS